MMLLSSLSRALTLGLDDVMVEIEAVVIPSVSTASVSLVASLAMVAMIARTEKGLSTPFRRIIFGLSSADILQSLGLVLGPFLLPSDTVDSWGIGTDQTCQASGFIFHLGSVTAPRYTFFLCWYYVCKLKYRMTNEAFSRKYEWKIHAFLILYVLITGTGALVTDIYHPVMVRTHCQITPYFPVGCQYIPEVVGECEPISRATEFFGRNTIISMAVSCLGIIICMIMLLHHAMVFSRTSQPGEERDDEAGGEKSDRDNSNVSSSSPTVERTTVDANNRSGNDLSNNSNSNSNSNTDPQNPPRHKENLRHLSQVYRQETVLQVACYIGAFFLSYGPAYVMFAFNEVAGAQTPSLVLILPFYLYPLSGFFNILVYTRPAIAALRRSHPEELSWLKCFWLVAKAGGEIPKSLPGIDDDDDQHQQGSQESMSAVQIGVANPSEHVTNNPPPPRHQRHNLASAQAVDGASESFASNDYHHVHVPKDKWSYVKGGNQSSFDMEERFDDDSRLSLSDAERKVSGSRGLESGLSISSNEKV